MTSMLTLGLVWLAVAVLVALPLGRLLRRADARHVLTTAALHRLEAEVLADADHDRPAPAAATRRPGQPAAGPPSATCAVQPAHADPTISRTS